MEQFIPPELRQHTTAIKAGFKVIQDGMKLSDPKDITKYSKKFIGIAKDGIKTGKILPSLVGMANVANSIMFSAMDMLGPLGGGAKTLVKTPVKVLDNAFKEVGGTLKYSKNIAKKEKEIIEDAQSALKYRNPKYTSKEIIFEDAFKEVSDNPNYLSKVYDQLVTSGQFKTPLSAKTAMGKVAKARLEKDPNDALGLYYKSLTKQKMSESGKISQKLITKEQKAMGQKTAAQKVRTTNINELYPKIQKEMMDNNLTIDEAIMKLEPTTKKSTRHYRVVGRFYSLADEIKKVNPQLHKFLDNEIKAYQIGKVTGKKSRYGTKEYEAARVALAKKLNINVEDIDRAHSMMAPRLAKLSKLVDEGTISVEQAKRLSKPQYFLLKPQNLQHVQLENKLDTLLNRKKILVDTKKFASANNVQKGIDEVAEEMSKLGVESELFDPVKKLIKVFGRKPETVELYKTAKENIKNLGQGGMIQKFDNGGEAEATGISSEPLSEEQDTSGVAGLMEEDVNQFIPPNLRFAKNLTGNMVLDFGAEMARYMTPGLGEYLSQEDYKLYSSELAQAVQNKEFLTAAGLAIPTALAMAGTLPNWTLVGVPISMAEAAVKKTMKPKVKQIEKPKDIRYKIRDKDGKTVYQTKNKQEAEDKAQKLSGDTGEDFVVDEIEFMPKEKVEVIESKPYDIVNDANQVVATRRNKNQAEKYLRRHPNENLKMIERNVPDVPRIDTTRLIDVGDNRQFYSKSQQAFDNGFDLSTGDAALTAKEWHDFFRGNGVREQELVDSYVRTLLDRKGGFNKETQTFTSNTKIKASEVKDLIDNAPAMKVQSVQFSDASNNLKYGDTGRISGAEAGSKRENVIWIDSADIRGDPGQLSSLAKQEGTQHKNFYDVKTDTVKFDAGKAKLEGEPYVIAWSLVDTRKGKDAFGKAIKVDLASEIQSDLLQKAATQKAKLKRDIAHLAEFNPADVAKRQKLLQEIEYIFRPMGRTATEIQELIQRLTANQQKFTAASKLELDDVTPALLKDLDQAKIDRDAILTDMFNIVDNVSINDLYPNLPLKNSKDWVDTVVKNDVYLAAKNRFTILEDGTIKINENAPSHYAPNSAQVVKEHWSSTGDEAGQMYDIIYNNAADSIKRIAKTTGSDVQLGKVKQGGSFVEVPMIELVPEMLYSQVQYFKDGGLVQKQYSPLVPLFKPLGVSYGY